MNENLHSHFENGENFILRCCTEQQYESCLKWCHDNGYLSDSNYKDLTDVNVYDYFTHHDLLDQDFKNGGRCIHFHGKQYKGIDDYSTYMRAKNHKKELSLNIYLYVDEIDEYGSIKTVIHYRCSKCGAIIADKNPSRCQWCKVKFRRNEDEETQ